MVAFLIPCYVIPTASHPSHHRHPRWHTIAAALAVLLFSLAVFLPTFRFDFVSFDDGDNVYANDFMNPVSARSLPRFWGEAYYELYTPVTYTLWTAIAAIPQVRVAEPVKMPGSSPRTLTAGAFHAEGVLLHTLNSLLVFCLLLRLPVLRGRSPVWAGIGAVLWAVHPLQAEPVAWVTGNNNVFSGTFMLLALLAFIKRLEAENDVAVLGWYLLASVTYALALLAKPTAAALPLVVFVLAVGVYRQSWRAMLLPLGAWLTFAAGFLFVTRNTGSPITDISLPVWQRPFVVGDALAFYVGKILLPIRLCLDYGRQPEWLRTQPWFYATWLVPVTIGAALLVWYKRTPNKETARTVISGFGVFVLGALPMLGIAPYYYHRYSTVCDRYVYLALIGVSIAVTAALASLPKRYRALSLGIAGALLVAAAVQCWQQTYAWHDSRSLYRNIVRVNPGSMMGHNNLAGLYMDELDFEAALSHLEQASRCRPEGGELPAIVQSQLGDVQNMRGEIALAIAAYRRGIALNPDLTSISAKLALVLWENGRQEEARTVVRETINHAEDPIRAAYDFGSVLLPKGVPEIGAPLLEQTAQTSSPYAADATYILAMWYNRRGDNVRALATMQKALQMRPHWGDAETVIKQLIPLAAAQQKEPGP